jgi:hypothetical protein
VCEDCIQQLKKTTLESFLQQQQTTTNQIPHKHMKRSRSQRSPQKKKRTSSFMKALFNSPSIVDDNEDGASDFDDYYFNNNNNSNNVHHHQYEDDKENISPFPKKNKLSINVSQCNSRIKNPTVSLLSSTPVSSNSPTRRSLRFDTITSPLSSTSSSSDCFTISSVPSSTASTPLTATPIDSLNDSFSSDYSDSFSIHGLSLESPSSASPMIGSMKFQFLSALSSSAAATVIDEVSPTSSNSPFTLNFDQFTSPQPDFGASSKRCPQTNDEEEYYAVASNRPHHCQQQRMSHAIFSGTQRKFKSMTSNLKLPSSVVEQEAEEPGIGDSHASELFSPVNNDDMSPGIFCLPTIFDTPDSVDYAMKLPLEKDARNRDCNTISSDTVSIVVAAGVNL